MMAVCRGKSTTHFAILLPLFLILVIQLIWCIELVASAQPNISNTIYANASSRHHPHRHHALSDNFWENKLRRTTKSAVRWPAIKLFNYTGKSAVVKHIDVVYDIVSNQHQSNIALFIQFLHHYKHSSSPAAAHSPTGGSFSEAPILTPYKFTYLFLVPSNVNSNILDIVDSFCDEMNNHGDNATRDKTGHSDKKLRCSRHMKTTALLWESVFAHFGAMSSKVDAVFMSRSSLVGPVLPHYVPDDFDVFKTFTQYLSPSLPYIPMPSEQQTTSQVSATLPTTTPVVLSSVSVHFRNKRKKAYVSVEAKDFPLMLSGEFARLLGKQDGILFGSGSGDTASSASAGSAAAARADATPAASAAVKSSGVRSWLMPTLGGGLGIHVLDPHYAHIDWLRYYDLCYLKHSISLTACREVEQTIPIDHAYVQTVGMNQTGIKQMFKQGISAMDFSIRTPLYRAYTSLFIDSTKLKSYEEYAYLVHVMNKQYNMTEGRGKTGHGDKANDSGWTGYLSSILGSGKPKSGRDKSRKAFSSTGASNSTLMKDIANMHSKKTLVVYVYFEANQEAIDNFIFFSQNGGIVPSNLVDYVIIVQGQHTVLMPNQFNVRIVYKENRCFDIGSWGSVIREVHSDSMQRKAQWDEAVSKNNVQVIEYMKNAYKHYVDYIYKYKYYIVMNTSVRGPYLPPSWNFGSHLWTEAFTKHISDEGLGDEKASSTGFASTLFGLSSITSSSTNSNIEADPKHRVKLVGLSINCPDGVGRKYPHIMSMLLAFDNVVADIWLNTKPNFDTVKFSPAAHNANRDGNPNGAFDPLASFVAPSEDTIQIDRPKPQETSQTQKNLVFDDILFCASEKKHSLAQESELSMAVFNAGYNVKSLQYYYRDMNWLGIYKQIVEDKKKATSHGNMISCSNILLDIFYKKAWNYKQTTPHPYDFVFVKTNRGIYKDDLVRMNHLAVDNRQFTVPHNPDLYISSPSFTPSATSAIDTSNETKVSYYSVDTINPSYSHLSPADIEYYPNTGYQKVVVMFSHNFNFEGAPMWLLRIATILKKWGYRIYMYSLTDGPLAKVLVKEGIEVIRFAKIAPFIKHDNYKDFLEWFSLFNKHISVYYNIKPTLYLFNTVLFTKFVANLPIFQSTYVRYMWAIHEAELYDAVKSPNNYAYEHEFKELRTLGGVYLAPHKILFVSDSGREYASRFDYGQFITIRGFVKDSKCFLDSNGNPVDNRADLLKLRTASRKILGIPEDAYVISNIGTICRRKQQHWLVDLLHQTHLNMIHNRPLYILLVGYDDKSMYEKEVRKYITRANLTQQIFLIKHNSYPLHYAAAADVHTSISTHESFPLNTLEVMCMGVPIMATPAFGIREQILFPGLTGVLLPGVRNYNGFQNHVKEFFGWELTRNRCASATDSNLTNNTASRKLQTIGDSSGADNSSVIATVSNSTINIAELEQSTNVTINSTISSSTIPTCLPGSLTPEEDAALRQKWLQMSYQAKQTVQKYFVESAIEPYYENLMQSLAPSHKSSVDKVCVVMRFHGGQIKPSGVSHDEYNMNRYFNIEESIRSIYFQQHTNWELILVPSDQSDVRAIYSLLVRYNHYFYEEVPDTPGEGSSGSGGGNAKAKRYSRSNNFNKIRMVTYHSLLEKYDKRNYGQFHQNLYNLTDRAIQQCSADSNWLLVTNGDNSYHEEFFNYLDPMYDIIAFDFYSRWYRHLQSSLPPCERLVVTPEDAKKSAKIFRSIRTKQHEDKNLDALYQSDKEAYYQHNKTLSEQSMATVGMISLLHNELRRNRTDLGANIVNLRRWLHEGHAYSHISSADSSQDGTMMEVLTEKGWAAKHITPGHSRFKKALYSHNPNYMSCVTRRQDMYWDDSRHLCYSQKDLDILKIAYKESSLYRCITTR